MCVLSLDLISMDGTQSRAAINEETVVEYAEKWQLPKAPFPPIKVFRDNEKNHWLADGFHRVLSALRAKRGSIIADVVDGTKEDALLYSLGANQEHGLRRTNEDKQRIVRTMLNHPDWVKWADNRIAEHVGVTQPFVSGIRKQLITVITSPAAKSQDEPREGKDGKKYKQPQPKAPKAVKPPKADGKISGGTSFDTAEIESATPPKPPKNGAAVKPEFDDAACKSLYVRLVKMLDERWELVGGQVGHRTAATKRLGESFEAYQKWVKG